MWGTVLAAAGMIVYSGLRANGGQPIPPQQWQISACSCSSRAVLLLSWLCVVRLAGYRLVFCWGNTIVGGAAGKVRSASARPVEAVA